MSSFHNLRLTDSGNLHRDKFDRENIFSRQNTHNGTKAFYSHEYDLIPKINAANLLIKMETRQMKLSIPRYLPGAFK